MSLRCVLSKTLYIGQWLHQVSGSQRVLMARGYTLRSWSPLSLRKLSLDVSMNSAFLPEIISTEKIHILVLSSTCINGLKILKWPCRFCPESHHRMLCISSFTLLRSMKASMQSISCCALLYSLNWPSDPRTNCSSVSMGLSSWTRPPNPYCAMSPDGHLLECMLLQHAYAAKISRWRSPPLPVRNHM